MARSAGCPYDGFFTHSLGYVRSGSNRTVCSYAGTFSVPVDGQLAYALLWMRAHGFGAWLEVDRQPKEFISEAWTDEDYKYFGHVRGSSDGREIEVGESKSTRLNSIARELSLDLAQNSHVLELQTRHVAGTENQWADALSRGHEPGQVYTVPNELAHLRRHVAPVRCDRFWKTQCHAGSWKNLERVRSYSVGWTKLDHHF